MPNPEFSGRVVYDGENDLLPEDRALETEGLYEYEIGPGDLLRIHFSYMTTGMTSGPYTIKIGDVLRVDFYEHPDLNRSVEVRRDGFISVPVAGKIEVVDDAGAGLTLEELEGILVEGYGKEFLDPNVTVTLVSMDKALREFKEAFGEFSARNLNCLVNPDGRVHFPRIKSLLAVGRTLDDLNEEVTMRYKRIYPEIETCVSLESMQSNLVYIVGSVDKPGFHNMRGPTTVMQAIALSGGFRPEAERSTVVIISRDKERHPVGQILNLDEVLEFGNIGRDMILRQYDIVYVPQTKISQVGKFIDDYFSNLLPIHTAFAMNYRLGGKSVRD